jgi:hypothetical protein
MPDEIKTTERFQKALYNAETLLRYAADEGIQVAAEIIGPIIEAHVAYGIQTVTKDQMMAFFAASTRLSATLRPVTAESIEYCEKASTSKEVASINFWALVVTLIVLLLSGLGFVNNAINGQINDDITGANLLAVSLRSGIKQVDPSEEVAKTSLCSRIAIPATGQQVHTPDELTQLQQFAQKTRDAYKRSLTSKLFIPYLETDQLDEQQRADLELNPTIANYQGEVFCKIFLYEKVRDFGTNVVLDNSYIWGAISYYVLPVLYALTGAYAFSLRSITETFRRKSYLPSKADSARIKCAVIIGAVISLFNFVAKNFSFSPLAVAFLAGYGVEIFFAFLDTLIKQFGRGQ